MPYDQERFQKEYRAIKGKITKAKNSKDPHKLIKVINEAERVFNEVGFPDCWMHWESLRDSARYQIRNAPPHKLV